MRKLRGTVSDVAKHKMIEARVLEVLGNRLAVQLSSNGRKLYGIPFTGGIPEVNDIVYVDYISGQPVAQCRARSVSQSQPETPRSSAMRTEFPPTQSLTSSNSSFLSLTDTPDDWGDPGQVPVISSSGSGFEWSDMTGGSSPAGSSNFLDLTDTPNSYSGQAGKFVRVNATTNALEFTDAPAGGGGETSGSHLGWGSFDAELRILPGDYNGGNSEIRIITSGSTKQSTLRFEERFPYPQEKAYVYWDPYEQAFFFEARGDSSTSRAILNAVQAVEIWDYDAWEARVRFALPAGDLQMIEQGSPPGTPPGGWGSIYAFDGKLYFKSDGGTVYDLTETGSGGSTINNYYSGGSTINNYYSGGSTINNYLTGGSTFLSLSDTPNSYSGQANKIVGVDPTGGSLVFLEPANLETFDYSIGATDLTTGRGAYTTANSYYYTSANAVDDNSSSDWASSDGTLPAWIKIDLGAGVTKRIGRYSIGRAGNDGGSAYITQWKLQGSNDDSNWTDIDSRTGETFSSPGQLRSFDVTSPLSYGEFRYFRVYITARASWVTISEWELFEYIATPAGGIGVFDSVADGQILFRTIGSSDGSLEITEADGNIDIVVISGGSTTGGGGDASEITYTPSNTNKWTGNTDPGNVDDALDQLANRIDSVEAVSTVSSQAIFTKEGTLEVASNPLKVYNATGSAKTITRVFLSAGTAPVGAAIIIDIHKGGTTIFTNQANCPQIADSATTGASTSIDVTSWGEDEYLTMHIDQVGSGTAGSDLVVHVVYS
jgi:hypothetical protein